MKPKAHDRMLMRVPMLPMDATLEECWEELKEAIRLASPSLYNEIAGVGSSQIGHLDDRILSAVRRYFNRAKYRPTPFGTFAGTCIVPTYGGAGESRQITLGRERCIHRFTDWQRWPQLLAYRMEDLLLKDASIMANSTLYEKDGNYRYLYREEHGPYELTDIDRYPFLPQILEHTARPIRISSLMGKVGHLFADRRECTDILENLILLRVLLTGLDPNLIGEDYFRRRGMVPTNDPSDYVISELRHLSGGLDGRMIRNMEALVSRLPNWQSKSTTSEELSTFMSRFSKRFDRQDVPLMVALDPEIGVGYGGLEVGSGMGELTREIASANHREGNTAMLARLLGRYLLPTTKVIRLDDMLDTEIKDTERDADAPAYPNTTNCVFSVADDLLVLERVGGASAAQLSGRFSVLGTEYRDYCRDLANAEMEANPEVLFFDIAYLGETHVDNVNRRARIYDHEVNVLCSPSDAESIPLGDIYISMAGNEVILRSKRLGKRLVPRISTAYNYLRADLSLFRFLCDLMYHDTPGEYGIDIVSVFPALPYYPRLQYRNIVVSPARWAVPAVQKSTTEKDWRAIIMHMGLPRFIRAGSGDQVLVLDTHHAADLGILYKMCSGGHGLLLEEALLPEKGNVKDETGRVYMPQFILPMIHYGRCYYRSSPIAALPPLPRAFPPGTNWLSLEVYVHPQSADRVLLQLAQLLLDGYGDRIDRWFFIRYNEGGEHLRLRTRWRDGALAEQWSALAGVASGMQGKLQNGTVADIAVRTYRREMERYAVAGMEQVEALFQQDSEFALEVARRGWDEHTKQRHCILFSQAVAQGCAFPHYGLIKWLRRISSGFNAEHGVNGNLLKKVNAHCRQLDIRPTPLQGNDHMGERMHRLVAAYVDLLTACPEDRRLPLFTDLVHMHINRCFAQRQRVQEVVIYNALLLRARKMRAISASGPPA